ncbi:MAG: hypothetical protein OHK0053_33380 [Microscillaceae bacterium]
MRTPFTEINFQWSNFLQGGMIHYIGGLYFLYRFVLVMMIFLSQYTWTETSAIVTQANINRTQETNSKVSATARFEYTYQVAGQTYKSRVFPATQLSLNPFEGAFKFQKGDKITIF